MPRERNPDIHDTDEPEHPNPPANPGDGDPPLQAPPTDPGDVDNPGRSGGGG